MRVVWTVEAHQDRVDIWDAIAQDTPPAASRIDESFSDAAARRAEYPKLGRPGTASGTRDLKPHESYRRVDEIHGDKVWILALVHSARRWPHAREA